jgi:hypothetical protein
MISQNYLCLGLLMNVGNETKRWTCVSRKIINIFGQDNSGVLPEVPQVEYEVAGPGIYAVILKPDIVVLD